MALEGFTNGTWATIDHSRTAADRRYNRTTFYALLDDVSFPVLPDGDERAMDVVFDGFQVWARSRKARKLIDRLSDDLGAESAHAEQDPSARVDDTVHHAVHHHVHDHVAHQVHQHVHAQVHHAVSHAAHSAGHSGAGHAGGSHH